MNEHRAALIPAGRRIMAVCIAVCWQSIVVNAENRLRMALADSRQQCVTIFGFDAIDGKGTIEPDKKFTLPFEPRCVVYNRRLNNLIATSGSGDEFLAATIKLETDGSPDPVSIARLNLPCNYASVDRTGRFFLTSDYGGGGIAVYRIDDDGLVGDRTSLLVTPKREAHCILTTRDNRFAYVPCVKNNNALFQFSFDDVAGILEPLTPFDAGPPAMFGPRHIAYHPELPICYFSNEQQLGISVFEIANDGQLNDLQHAVTMPRRTPFENGKRDLHASDLAITPDGKRMYVAVRDFGGDEDSVFAFGIDADGRLRLLARTSVGDIPWKIGLSPCSKFLIVSETGDHAISVYRASADGTLRRAANLAIGVAARDFVVMPY